MIRVYCVPAGRFKAPLSGPPVLEAPTARALDEIMVRTPHPLAPPEVAAVRRALESMITPPGLVSIAVASGGGVFRIESGAPARPAEPSPVPSPNCWTRHRDALVLVAYDLDAWNQRARDALRFLGYAASLRGETDEPSTSLAAEVAGRRPAAVLVGPRTVAREGAALAESALRGPSALVLLSPAPGPPVAGAIALPIRLASLAPAIDDAIDRVRAGSAAARS
jgi:hypothetical protein